MAFVAALNRVATNEDGSKLYIKDVTGNYGDSYYVQQEDGTYEQVDNTTGYGAQNNVLKSDYARIVYGIYHDLNKDKEVVFPEAYLANEVNIEEFIFNISKDGYYTFHMALVPRATGAGSVGDIEFFIDSAQSPYGGTLNVWEAGQWENFDLENLVDFTAPNVIMSEVLHDGNMHQLNRAYNKLEGRLMQWEMGQVSLDKKKADYVLSRMEIVMSGFSNAWILYDYERMVLISSKNQELIKLANEV